MDEPKLISKAKTISLPKDGAGHKMTLKVPIASSSDTIADVRSLVISGAGKFESINYVYIVSKSRKLKGVISIREVFKADPASLVKEVMATKLVKAYPETDQERVARMAISGSIKSVPIIDRQGKLVGVLTSDTILSIVDQESHEDLLRMSGIIPLRDHYTDALSLPVSKSVFARLPWLILGLFGGILAAKIIVGFEETLQENLILAFFIPLIVYISDAVGTQTQTLIIRDLAVIRDFSITKYAFKQSIISVFIGIACGTITFLMVFLMWSEMRPAIAIGISTSVAIFSSVIVSLVTPYTFYKLKQDPAVASGPFATIVQDLLSILIYLSVASLFI